MMEDRKRKEFAATVQITPLILPSLNGASKVKFLRYSAERAGIPAETIDEALIDTPSMALQCMENEILALNEYIPINMEDNDEEHLVEMGSVINTEAFELHKVAHIQAMITKGTASASEMQQAQGGGVKESSIVNGMASQSAASA